MGIMKGQSGRRDKGGQMKRSSPTRFHPVSERLAFGQERRKVLSRVDLGVWKPAKSRPDPVALLLAAERGRLPHLLRIKHDRMVASPFGFFRGAAPLMAWDLAHRPRTGIEVQLCGDAHVRNLGAFAAEDGHLVFDINDFDETTPGPFEWDLCRLAASFVLAAREAGDTDRSAKEAVRILARSYREGLRRFLSMSVLDLMRYEIRRHLEEGPIYEVLAKAERVTPQASLKKLTVPDRQKERRFVHQPPLITRVPPAVTRQVIAALRSYRSSIGPARRLVLDAYRPVDVAFKIVGTGSVGTRDYVVLLFGASEDDPLFLQVKEALASCYAPYLRGMKVPAHDGERVAEGQHRMQTLSDPFLGWTTVSGRPFIVRQLSDHKASLDPRMLRGSSLVEYALVVGEIFAKAHARTGDPVVLLGYLGRSERFDDALARFAAAYADQTVKDHAAFVAKVRPRSRRPARRVKTGRKAAGSRR
jgi:uncharacterized protein (DUF2252 family)